MGRIAIGTCGYSYYDPGTDWPEQYESKLAAYADAFEVGEINRTFYSLPQVSTTERWRREAGEDFEFTLKAWQALTHPTSSPTWNGHRDDLTEDREDGFGYLRPTDVVRDAWAETKKRAKALEANVVLLQTPPSFDASEDHEDDMRDLLSTIDRDGLVLAWEPRGEWLDRPERVASLCSDLDLVHVVDLLRREPRTDHDIAYLRLHGRNEDSDDYDYEYAAAELDRLAERLQGLAADHDRVYCLFNNSAMYRNATALGERLTE